MKTKYFINLSTGIEAIAEMPFLQHTDISFVRIQSSHCEAAAFEDILLGLDANFLMYLALGYTCIVIDYGARSHTSKAVRIGLEWIRYFLNIVWLNKRIKPIINQKDVSEFFYENYIKVSKKTRSKFRYYRKYLQTNQIRLIGLTKSTEYDGYFDNYIHILKENLLD